MDYGTFLGIITLVLMCCFLGLFVWAYSRRRHAQFEEAANLVFADDKPSASKTSSNTGEQGL